MTYVAELDALELDGVEPMAHAVPLHNVFREDEKKPSLDHELALSNAPEAEDGYFEVPLVLYKNREILLCRQFMNYIKTCE